MSNDATDADRDAELLAWAKTATRGLPESSIFLQLFNEKFRSDPLSEPAAVIQLGLAVLLDKPILLLVPKGARLPANLRRLATAIEEFDPTDNGSIFEATKRLLKAQDLELDPSA